MGSILHINFIMYSFSELCSEQNHTFCYLLGVLKKWPPPKLRDPEVLAGGFEWLLNVEDQSQTVWQTRRRCDLTKKYVLPSAPLTMTPSWSPFPLAFDVMPKVFEHARGEGEYSPAFAIFDPTLRIARVDRIQFHNQWLNFEIPVADHDLTLENIHAQHFLWLLNMTAARARRMHKPVVLIGTPGFGYDNQLEHDTNPETKLRLLEAGYLYPSRVPQGARFAFLTDLAARAAYEQRQTELRELSPKMPPPPCGP